MREKIQTLIDKKIEDSGYFLVELNVTENPPRIEIFLDGDDGINIEKCTEISRYINNALEDEGFEKGDFELTVSSPGIDRPLIMKRQYKKNVGRKLLINTQEGLAYKGKLIYYDDHKIILKGNKAGINPQSIELSNIETAVVKI